MEKNITFVGLDVHKKSVSVAVANGGFRGEARFFGAVVNRPVASRRLRFCCGAGPRDYGIHRMLPTSLIKCDRELI